MNSIDDGSKHTELELRCDIIYKSAIPVLRPYLNNTSDTNYNGLRLCDHAS